MIDVITVTHNSDGAIADFLHALSSSAEHIRSLIVVDSASRQPPSLELDLLPFPARLVTVRTNVGFGTAVNIGSMWVETPSFLVVNPDCTLNKRALGQLKDAICTRDLDAVGPRIVRDDESDGTEDRRIGATFTPIWRRRWGGVEPRCSFSLVETLSGACFLVRTSAFRAVGGFDERYFMYGEEADLFARMRAHGLRVGYVGSAEVLHVGEAGSSGVTPAWRALHRSLGRARYHRLHHGLLAGVVAAISGAVNLGKGRGSVRLLLEYISQASTIIRRPNESTANLSRWRGCGVSKPRGGSG